MAGGFFPTQNALESNRDTVVVALVRCAARPAVAHIPGLPDPSGDIVMYAGGGGGGGLTVNQGRLLMRMQGIAESGMLGLTSMKVICFMEVVRADLASG